MKCTSEIAVLGLSEDFSKKPTYYYSSASALQPPPKNCTSFQYPRCLNQKGWSTAVSKMSCSFILVSLAYPPVQTQN